MAYSLSMRVICELTGLEVEREAWLRSKLAEVSQAASYADLPEHWDVQAYFWEMAARRLAHPRNELLDVLLQAWKDERIDGNELLGFLYGFAAAGTDTTGTNFVNAFALLAEFDLMDYARGVIGDETAVKRIVEEVLRFGTPFPTKPLFVVADSRFGELFVPSGSVVHVWYAAANRDVAVNGNVAQSHPDTFDPCRWPNRHLALGRGKHHCLGGELARLETRIVLEEALTRLPGLTMDEDKPFVRHAGIVDGVTEAHFRFDPEQAVETMERLRSTTSAAPAGRS